MKPLLILACFVVDQADGRLASLELESSQVVLRLPFPVYEGETVCVARRAQRQTWVRYDPG